MTGLCSASLLLFHPPSAIRSSFQLALMPLMPLSPRAVFEVGGSYVVTGVSGELGGGDERGHLKFMLLDGMGLQLSLSPP